MARRLELTLACGDYEIVRALKEGIVRRRLPLDELFLNVSEGRKRDEFRI